jgi:hypothetical protein
LQVKVAARPWNQAADAKVSADRKHSLPGVVVGSPSFTLAPGQSRLVDVSLAAAPAAGAEYGALEVIGLPADARTRKGVVLGYRLIGTLRLLPATPRRKLSGALAVDGRSIVLDLRNLGNTLDPVSGTVSVKDARGTRSPAIDDLRILPGKQVRLKLAKGLAAGTVSASVRLTQAGKRALVIKKKLNVR